MTVRDAANRVVFESGALRPDGSVEGNDNDADPKRFEPHYTEIRSSDQVQIYEPILKDQNGNVTTSLLSAIGYAKDNRLLPHGFEKATATPDIAVYGGAAQDPAFNDSGHRSLKVFGSPLILLWGSHFYLVCGGCGNTKRVRLREPLLPVQPYIRLAGVIAFARQEVYERYN